MNILTDRLATVLQIRASETRMVVLVAGMMFIASAGGAIGSPGVEALFYARFGVQYLPTMYIALGLLTLVTSLGITALLGQVDRKRLYVVLPLALAIVLAGERFILMFRYNWFYPVLWLGMNLFWTLQALFAWGLAATVCDARQAKRLFPLFGASGILGLATGGLVTKPLVGWLGAENLLLVWAVALAVIFYLAQALIGKPAFRIRRQMGPGPSLLDDFQQGYRFVRQSTLMRWMSAAAVLFAVLYFSLVFPFSKAAAAQFPSEDSLAGFLGVFQGLSTAAAVLLSLFLANRLFARFGFMTMILVYPILYLAGFSVLAINSTFPALVGLRFLQVFWSEGVSEGANQAMFNVVPPDQREQTRAFVRGVANQLGVFLAGIILLLSQETLQSRGMFLIGVATAAVTVFFVWRARQSYGQAVVAALRAGQPQLFFSEEQPFGGFQLDADALDATIKGIHSPEVAIRRVSAEILGHLPFPLATDTLVRALQDEDPTVRATLLRSLAGAKATPAILEVLHSLEDPQPEVRLQAIETLSQLAGYPTGLANQLRPLLEDKDAAVRSHAAAVLLRTSSNPTAEEMIRKMASEGNLEERILAYEALAVWGSQEAYELAATGLNDPHPAIRRVAATILARIDAEQCIFPLVATLADDEPSVRAAAAIALGQVGPPALEAVISALRRPASEDGALLTLKYLPIQKVAREILAYARDQVEKALYYHNFWMKSRLADREDEGCFRLLADSLREKSTSFAIRSIRAAGLLENQEWMELAIDHLNSRIPAQRANAIEILESTGRPEIVRPLLRLWESPAANPDPQHDWLGRLLEDSDPWLRACAALVAGGFKDPQLSLTLNQMALSDPDALARESAWTAIHGGNSMKTIPTLSLIERILFLRRVPLFAELPPTDLKQIAAITTEHFFTDEEVIVQQGEPGDEMFIIVSGEVRVVAAAEEGGTAVEIVRRKPGEYVGEMAIISQEPRMASLVACGEVRTLCINQLQFEGILRMRPETSLVVMRVLCDRLKESMAGKRAYA